jgi:hypothetical protein
MALARGQLDELLAPRNEERIGGDEQRIASGSQQSRKAAAQSFGGCGAEDLYFLSDETRRRRYVFAVQVSSRILRVHKHRYQFRFGRYFAQQLQLLAYEGVAEKVIPVTFAPQWGGLTTRCGYAVRI